MGIADKVNTIINRDKAILKKDVQNVTLAMIKVLTEGRGDSLRELLFMCSPYFGDGELSIIRSNERSIVASTYEEVYHARTENVALYVKEVDKKRHYLKMGENGLFFPKGVECIRIYPLAPMGGAKSFLLVEQSENIDNHSERMLDVLSIATRIYLQEINQYRAMKTDYLTGLGNRDALMDFLENVDVRKEGYLAMYGLLDVPQYVEDGDMTKLHMIMGNMADILTEAFGKEVFRVGDGKICVWSSGNMYEIVSTLQDCLDKMVTMENGVHIACVVNRYGGELYKSLYLCEKACDEDMGDAVMLVREEDGLFDVSEEEKMLFLGMENVFNQKEKDSAFYKEKVEPVRKNEEPEQKTEESGECDNSTFVDWSEFGGL